jgi:hypothetical protein
MNPNAARTQPVLSSSGLGGARYSFVTKAPLASLTHSKGLFYWDSVISLALLAVLKADEEVLTRVAEF